MDLSATNSISASTMVPMSTKAIQIVLDTLKNIEGILQDDKQPSVSVSTLGDSSLVITAYYWLDTFDPKVSGNNVKTAATSQALEALSNAGFYLPGNIMELKNYKDTPLEYFPANNTTN